MKKKIQLGDYVDYCLKLKMIIKKRDLDYPMDKYQMEKYYPVARGIKYNKYREIDINDLITSHQTSLKHYNDKCSYSLLYRSYIENSQNKLLEILFRKKKTGKYLSDYSYFDSNTSIMYHHRELFENKENIIHYRCRNEIINNNDPSYKYLIYIFETINEIYIKEPKIIKIYKKI